MGALAVEPALRKTTEGAISMALLNRVSQMEKQVDFSKYEER